jgi:hypothetical protein
MRASANWLTKTLHWDDWLKKTHELFAPWREGQAAEDTASLLTGINATTKGVSHMAMRAIAEDEGINSLFRGALESSRRESRWNNHTDGELAEMQTLREKGQKVADPVADRLFDFTRSVYDWAGNYAKANGLQFQWLENYFRHSFEDSPQKEQFIRDWQARWGDPSFTKERKYPTLADALAAGLKPKTYNPERNMLAYVANVVNAVRQVQALSAMLEHGLAIRSDAPLAKSAADAGWARYRTPDKKSYMVVRERIRFCRTLSIWPASTTPWPVLS